jgi:hypothetical protein
MRYLAILLFPLSLFAETTGNLITNGTFENGNSNGWTTTGEVTVLNDCCGSQYDLEIGLSGSISQSFDLTSDTITQPMLDNGITLNSSVQVQNGECGVAQCWGGSGPADSFSVQLQIKDSDNNVLATTTQERTNVTGINGKDFSDSVTYTQSGSNRGGITISGTDSNGVAGGLGGPNFDNVEVTMTYDPVVLTTSQTETITTAINSIEELENEIEIIQFIPIEEIRFEEYIEPEVLVSFEEFFVTEIATEEINTGIVNIFEEVTYEEPQTIETFSAEIEGFETKIETTEITNTETFELSGETELAVREEEVGGTETEGVAGEEVSGTGNGEASTENETTVVAQSEQESSGGVSSGGEQSRNENSESESMVSEDDTSSETETEVASEEVNETDRETETVESEQGGEGTEVASQDSQDAESGNVEMEESRDSESAGTVDTAISVENIERKVNQTIKRVDQRLIATSLIVAKAMSNDKILDTYNNINTDIFNNQVFIDGGNYYDGREFIDTRNIYAENQNMYNDSVAQYQKNLQESIDNTIRAEEHLRRIRGY